MWASARCSRTAVGPRPRATVRVPAYCPRQMRCKRDILWIGARAADLFGEVDDDSHTRVLCEQRHRTYFLLITRLRITACGAHLSLSKSAVWSGVLSGVDGGVCASSRHPERADSAADSGIALADRSLYLTYKILRAGALSGLSGVPGPSPLPPSQGARHTHTRTHLSSLS